MTDQLLDLPDISIHRAMPKRIVLNFYWKLWKHHLQVCLFVLDFLSDNSCFAATNFQFSAVRVKVPVRGLLKMSPAYTYSITQ